MTQPVHTERFQVDLKGVMEVLAKHLYSSRDVFVRELLQNGVDAITARRSLELEHPGRVLFEPDPKAGVLTVTDNGIGLTEEQIRSALSKVGGSTKRADTIESARSTLIGQFGIGMLSCFMVAEEIVVLTRAVGDDSPGFEWIGRSDGTYTVRPLTREIEPGTRVVLKLMEEAKEYARPKRVLDLAGRFGKMLSIDVMVQDGKYPTVVNACQRPWELDLSAPGGATEAAEAVWDWSEAQQYDIAFPLDDKRAGLQGVGFLLRGGGGDPSRLHRVYIKGMFVTENGGDLIPEWAAFCRCLIDSDRLRPTASRESVYEDKTFKQTKRSIQRSLLAYLHGLAEDDPGLLRAILDQHELCFRRVAIEDNRFFDSIIDLLDFESSEGWVRMGDFRKENATIRVVPTSEQFRLVAPLARLRGQVVFNGGYVYHADLLRKAAERIDGMGWMPVQTRELLGGLEPAVGAEAASFRAIADRLGDEGFPAHLSLVRFEPSSIAGLYVEGAGESLARSIDAAMGEADQLWREVLGQVRGAIDSGELGTSLCLNAANGSVQELLRTGPGPLAGAIVRMIYVQSLIEAQQPLSPDESRMFSDAVGEVLRAGTGGVS
jgi:molecular chaperone HtpG